MASFIKRLVLLFALVALVANVGLAETEIKQIIVNDDLQMISTSVNNYALSGQQLADGGVEAVSVTNGNNFVVYGHGCDVNVSSFENLPENTRTLINATRGHFDDSMVNQPSAQSSFTFRGDTVLSQNSQSTTFNSNGYLIHQAGKNSFSVSKEGLPNNLERIFVTDHVTTLVFKDGLVQMKPNVCLQPDVQQMLAPIMLSIQQVEIFRQLLRDSEQKLSQQVSDTSDHLEARTIWLRQGLNTGLQGLHQKIDQRHSALQATLADGFGDVNDKVQRSASGLNAAVQGVHQRVDQLQSAVQVKLADGFGDVNDKMQRSASGLNSIIQGVHHRIDQFQSAVQVKLADGLGDVRDKMEQRVSGLNAAVQGVHQRIDQLQSAVQVKLADGFGDVNDKMQRSASGLNASIQGVRHRIDQFQSTVQAKLADGFGDANDKMQQRVAGLNAAVQGVHQKIDQRHSTIQAKLADGFGDVSDKIQRSVSGLNATVQGVHQRIEQLQSTVQVKLADGFGDVNDKMQRSASGLNAAVQGVHQRIDQLQSAVQVKLADGLGDVRDKMEQRFSLVVNKIDATNQVVASVKDELKNVTNILGALQQKLLASRR